MLGKTKKSAFNMLVTGIIVSDNHNKVIFINNFFLKKFNFSEKEVIGRKMKEIFLSRPDNLFEAKEKGLIFEITSREEKTLTIYIVNDVTKYVEKIKKIRLVSKTTRHDAINALAVIQSAINTHHRDNYEIKGFNNKMTLEIKKIISTAVEMINKMRQLESIISKNNLKIHKIEEVARAVISQYNIIITISGSAEILADEGIHSVFINIINNAIRHGKADIVNIKITRSKKNIKVKILNNGSQIDNKILNKIFNEGVKSSLTGNTGLGLYIINQTILRYGGTVEVKNLKEGVLFILKFPLI